MKQQGAAFPKASQRIQGQFSAKFALWAAKSRSRREWSQHPPCPSIPTNIHINSSTKSPHPSGYHRVGHSTGLSLGRKAENSLLILIYFLQDCFSHSLPFDRIFTLPQTPSSRDSHFHFLILPCPKKSDLEGCSAWGEGEEETVTCEYNRLSTRYLFL